MRALDEYQREGTLGCFGLTEKLAGVNSGLIVQTVADWNGTEFVMTTPTEGSEKNWISQGYVCDKAVVMADLNIDGESKGPHAFVMDFRDAETEKLAQGVKITDMGRKTIGNDLDNASISFDGAVLPKSALLSRFATIADDGTYKASTGATPMQMIGQRLFTGRVAVAQAALEFRREIFRATKVSGVALWPSSACVVAVV